ncbi:MAG TPA: hypothetical protein VGK47_08885 [Nitrososphaeraceae archaeon]
MKVSHYIIAVLIILQLIGSGIIIGNLGENKKGSYSMVDFLISFIIAGLMSYVFWELSQ